MATFPCSTFDRTKEDALILRAYIPTESLEAGNSEKVSTSLESEWKRVVAATERQYALLQRTPLPFKPGRDRHEPITPFAYNQVKLQDGTDTNGSWISCSYGDKPGKYIAISAPMPEYFNVFMRMLYENKVRGIVNLTGFVEDGRRKADPYLPVQQGEKIKKDGEYTVTCEKVYPSYRLSKNWALEQRDFRLEVEG